MNKMCDYCGENKSMKQIPNPNFDEDNLWDVCITCERVIEQQHKLTLGSILKEKLLGKKYGEKLVKEASQKLKEISYEADIPILSIGFAFEQFAKSEQGEQE